MFSQTVNKIIKFTVLNPNENDKKRVESNYAINQAEEKSSPSHLSSTLRKRIPEQKTSRVAALLGRIISSNL